LLGLEEKLSTLEHVQTQDMPLEARRIVPEMLEKFLSTAYS
jgi:hypothetical protein